MKRFFYWFLISIPAWGPGCVEVHAEYVNYAPITPAEARKIAEKKKAELDRETARIKKAIERQKKYQLFASIRSQSVQGAFGLIEQGRCGDKKFDAIRNAGFSLKEEFHGKEYFENLAKEHCQKKSILSSNCPVAYFCLDTSLGGTDDCHYCEISWEKK